MAADIKALEERVRQLERGVIVRGGQPADVLTRRFGRGYGAAWEAPGLMLLDSVTLGVAAQTLADFTSITAKFRNLRLVWHGTAAAGSTVDRNIGLRFNNDAGNNYTTQRQDDGTQTQSLNTSFAVAGRLEGTEVGSRTWGVVDILNYADATFQRGLTFSGGARSAAGLQWRSGAATWQNSAAAINQVTVFSDAATAEFAVDSVCYLYGY